MVSPRASPVTGILGVVVLVEAKREQWGVWETSFLRDGSGEVSPDW